MIILKHFSLSGRWYKIRVSSTRTKFILQHCQATLTCRSWSLWSCRRRTKSHWIARGDWLFLADMLWRFRLTLKSCLEMIWWRAMIVSWRENLKILSSIATAGFQSGIALKMRYARARLSSFLNPRLHELCLIQTFKHRPDTFLKTLWIKAVLDWK